MTIYRGKHRCQRHRQKKIERKKKFLFKVSSHSQCVHVCAGYHNSLKTLPQRSPGIAIYIYNRSRNGARVLLYLYITGPATEPGYCYIYIYNRSRNGARVLLYIYNRSRNGAWVLLYIYITGPAMKRRWSVGIALSLYIYIYKTGPTMERRYCSLSLSLYIYIYITGPTMERGYCYIYIYIYNRSHNGA